MKILTKLGASAALSFCLIAPTLTVPAAASDGETAANEQKIKACLVDSLGPTVKHVSVQEFSGQVHLILERQSEPKPVLGACKLTTLEPERDTTIYSICINPLNVQCETGKRSEQRKAIAIEIPAAFFDGRLNPECEAEWRTASSPTTARKDFTPKDRRVEEFIRRCVDEVYGIR